jgi:hypothetical protein
MEREDERVTEGLLPSHDGAVLMDELIQQADAVGGFRKVFNSLFNFCAVIVGVMSVYSLVLAMKVPDHWCYVPGRASTNFSLSEWKHLTLPRYYIIINHRADCPSGNALDAYSGGARFESRGFSQSLQANAGIFPQVFHDCFLPNPFQIIPHLSS